jgi:hypothetical protein
MCRTLVLLDLDFFCSAYRAFSAASQSKTECRERALNGDMAVLGVKGESRQEMAGLGGSLRLGKLAGPVRGADMGAEVGKGLGGTNGAVAGGEFLLAGADVGDGRALLHEQSEGSLLAAVLGNESGVSWPDEGVGGVDGEPRALALLRKSM